MAESNSTTTIIGTDTLIKGEMIFQSAAKILGKFEGKLTAKSEVHVGQGAQCKASVDAATLVVDGEIEGNVTARERATLNSSAKVIGDITARTLVVAEGATFTGKCQVGADAVERATASTTTEERPLAVETRVNNRSGRYGYDNKLVSTNGESTTNA